MPGRRLVPNPVPARSRTHRTRERCEARREVGDDRRAGRRDALSVMHVLIDHHPPQQLHRRRSGHRQPSVGTYRPGPDRWGAARRTIRRRDARSARPRRRCPRSSRRHRPRGSSHRRRVRHAPPTPPRRAGRTCRGPGLAPQSRDRTCRAGCGCRGRDDARGRVHGRRHDHERRHCARGARGARGAFRAPRTAIRSARDRSERYARRWRLRRAQRARGLRRAAPRARARRRAPRPRTCRRRSRRRDQAGCASAIPADMV